MLSQDVIQQLRVIAPQRNSKLFVEFLPRGYTCTTLDTVGNKADIVGLKVLLGTIITLYDDFADRPDRLNPQLLERLYQVPFEAHQIIETSKNESEVAVLTLARNLFQKLKEGMRALPLYSKFFPIFCFDLRQFFLANHYSELVTINASLNNRLENRLYMHHNMGIVMAGMIDLMSLPKVRTTELGSIRSLFLLGQRAGRISNVLTTKEREFADGDRTGEPLEYGEPNLNSHCPHPLESERIRIMKRMAGYEDIRSFSPIRYCSGIQALHDLHINLKEVI